MSFRDSSPVYYREIQKNAYLKRIPDDVGGSKLRPLGLKKPMLKPLWTQLCVHNGRTPYLEQYRDPSSARAHRPVWRASLLTARHVTASVVSRDFEYDFLVDTHQGPVRMLAPDWESMKDWVTTLRNKLHELKILPLCENVYAAPPAAPAPRAAARDPTSPLPPTPPVPPDRVPGIDLTPIVRTNTTAPPTEPPQAPEPEPTVEPPSATVAAPDNIDISSWEAPEASFASLPSTSQAPKSVAKICGQNICVDDSIFKRTSESDDDDDFLSEERCSVSSDANSYRQTVVISDGKQGASTDDGMSDRPSNITVIQVSNKEPPHTAIPVIGPETDVFDFDFKTATNTSQNPNFVNIVNTEVNVQNSNEYGTVFEKAEPEYGHLSLTTTVSLTGDVKLTDVNVEPSDVNVKSENEGLYERLCLASTANDFKASPLPIRRLKSREKVRKSSLPNLDTISSDSTHEYLFLCQNYNTGNTTLTSTNFTSTPSNITTTPNNITTTPNNIRTTPNNVTTTPNITSTSTNITTTAANVTTISTNTNSRTNTTNVTLNSEIDPNSRQQANGECVRMNSVIVDLNARAIMTNIERSDSSTYDGSPRREAIEQKNSARRNGKVEKLEPSQPKPIWKRGLTELSLLTRLRGIGQGKRQESPTRNGAEHDRNALTSPVKVVHRSRPEVRVDRNRRRSSSLSNGQSPSTSIPPLLPLRARQAAALRGEQRRGAALVAAVRCADPPLFVDYNKQVWVAWWGGSGVRCAGRAGDSVCGVRGAAPRDAAHARSLLTHARAHTVDILFHRVPLGKIYVVNKRDHECTGIKLDNECNITSVEAESPAAAAGIPPPGKWAVTEVNNRPINLLKGGDGEMNRLSLYGTEASVLIQPSALVKKLRTALKGNKTLLGLR